MTRTPIRLYRHTQTPPLTMQQRFPPLFATVRPGHEDSPYYWVFHADKIAGRRETYTLSPRRITDPHLPAFAMEDRPRYPWTDESTFHIERPDWPAEMHTGWRYIGVTVYSMAEPVPIPVIQFYHGGMPLQYSQTNRIRAMPGRRSNLRVWERRWDPDAIADDMMEAEHSYGPAAAGGGMLSPDRSLRVAEPPPVIPATPTAPTAPTSVAATPLPKYVTELIIADAVAKAHVCPITLEPITATTAAVTSCFHVFDANAIAIWFADHSTCAVCKQPATV